MRRALAGLAVACIAVACVDLFHDTDFTLPTVDASVDAADAALPPVDAPTPPLDFCALAPGEGVELAKRACSLLAACVTPIGNSATGACLSRALPAMECSKAKERAVRGPALDYYRCIATARDCSAMRRCVSPEIAPGVCATTGNDITRCLGDSGVRVDCPTPGQPAGSESCAAVGRICDEKGTFLGACTGKRGLDRCTTDGCDDTFVRRCVNVDGGRRDDGYDCAIVGRGSCVDTDAGPTCAPNGETCAAIGEVKCEGSVAMGCIGGYAERIDCAIFGGQCTTSAAARAATDLALACDVPADAGACDADTCSSGGVVLTACVRGNRVPIDCAGLLQTSCSDVRTSDGVRAACRAP